MVALLEDAAVLHDEDPVGAADRGEPVRDDEARAPLHQFVERLLNQHFCARVDAGRRLVEDQHRRQAKHDARDAQQLLLPLAQALVRHNGVKLLRHAADEFPAVGLLRRADDLLVGRVRFAEGDVLAHCAVAEPRLLKDHAVAAAQGSPRHVTNILPVDRDRAAVGVVKPHQQIDQRRLAAARRPDDGGLRTRLRLEVEVLDQLLALIVGKGYIPNLNASPAAGKLRIRLFGLRLRLDQLENARRTGERILELGDDGGNVVERLHVLRGVGQKDRESADRELSPEDPMSADQRDQRVDDVVHRARRRVCKRAEKDCTLRITLQLLVDYSELLRSFVAAAKCFDDLFVADVLIDESSLPPPGLSLAAEHRK